MEKVCAIVSGGPFSNFDGIEKSDFIIACDKGYEYLKANHLYPDLLVGDFDSCFGALPENIPKIKLPRQKDDTDTMFAVKHAVFGGFQIIKMYCAFGGRVDHAFSNIQTAVWASKKIKQVMILSRNDEIYFINGTKIIVPKKFGYSLSVFSMTDSCHNVCIKNTKYILNNSTLNNDSPIGVSNEWIDDAEISVESGILMVVLSKLDGEKNGLYL